jgi:hypothetical protein
MLLAHSFLSGFRGPDTHRCRPASHRLSAAQAVSLVLSSSLSLSAVSGAFAAGTTLPTLQDDTKRNAGVQLIYEARGSRPWSPVRAAVGR